MYNIVKTQFRSREKKGSGHYYRQLKKYGEMYKTFGTQHQLTPNNTTTRAQAVPVERSNASLS